MRQLNADELVYEGKIFRRENREAKENEYIQVVRPQDGYEDDYKYGEVLLVISVDSAGVDVEKTWHDEADGKVFLFHEEYDVITLLEE